MKRDKGTILSEIRRTASENGGAPLGWRRFEEVTGIGYYEWYGQFWTRWGDAVREAGFEPNRMAEAYSDDFLIEKLIALTRRLGRVPVHGDLRLEVKVDPTFPSDKVFRRLGTKPEQVSRVIAFCESREGHSDVLTLWRQAKPIHPVTQETVESFTPAVGYVYLLQHGSRREFKIGRTMNPIRREGEISLQLPEKLEPIHYIKTDDPSGVERYWHNRFADQRKEGEWFALTPQDVKAFKRWKNIF